MHTPNPATTAFTTNITTAFPRGPLHLMNESLLSLELSREIDRVIVDPSEREMLTSALTVALLLHEGYHSPSASGSNRREPFSVRPLRYTLQLIRWGVDDAEMLAASLLNLTVTNHSEDLVQLFLGNSVGGGADHEVTAIQWIRDNYSPRTATLVKWVVDGSRLDLRDTSVPDAGAVGHSEMVRDHLVIEAARRVVGDTAFIESALTTGRRSSGTRVTVRGFITQRTELARVLVNPLHGLNPTHKTAASTEATIGLDHTLNRLHRLDDAVRLGQALTD